MKLVRYILTKFEEAGIGIKDKVAMPLERKEQFATPLAWRQILSRYSRS